MESTEKGSHKQNPDRKGQPQPELGAAAFLFLFMVVFGSFPGAHCDLRAMVTTNRPSGGFHV